MFRDLLLEGSIILKILGQFGQVGFGVENINYEGKFLS